MRICYYCSGTGRNPNGTVCGDCEGAGMVKGTDPGIGINIKGAQDEREQYGYG